MGNHVDAAVDAIQTAPTDEEARAIEEALLLATDNGPRDSDPAGEPGEAT